MNNIKATKKIKNYDILFFDELCYNINIIHKMTIFYTGGSHGKCSWIL